MKMFCEMCKYNGGIVNGLERRCLFDNEKVAIEQKLCVRFEPGKKEDLKESEEKFLEE